jgi:hypothetical protein
LRSAGPGRVQLDAGEPEHRERRAGASGLEAGGEDQHIGGMKDAVRRVDAAGGDAVDAGG